MNDRAYGNNGGDRSKIGVGSNTQGSCIDGNLSVDRRLSGLAEGVAAAEHQGSKAGLDQRTGVGNDPRALGHGLPEADVQGQVADQIHVVIKGGGDVPEAEIAPCPDDGRGAGQSTRSPDDEGGAGIQRRDAGVAVGRVGEFQIAAASRDKPGRARAGDCAAEGHHAGSGSDVEGALHVGAQRDRAAQHEVGVAARAEEGVCCVGAGEGDKCAAWGDHRRGNRASESDRVAERADGKERPQTGGVRLDGAAIETKGACPERGVVAQLQDNAAIDSRAAAEGVWRVQNDGAGIVDQRRSGGAVHEAKDRAASRTHEHGGVHSQSRSAAPDAVGVAGADSQSWSGVGAALRRTEEIKRSRGERRTEANRINPDDGVGKPVRAALRKARKRTIVGEPQNGRSRVVGIQRNPAGEIRRSRQTQHAGGLHGESAATKGSRTRAGGSENTLLHRDGASVGGVAVKQRAANACLYERGATDERTENQQVIGVKNRRSGGAAQRQIAKERHVVAPLDTQGGGSAVEGHAGEGGVGGGRAQDGVTCEHHCILEERVDQIDVVAAAIEGDGRTGGIGCHEEAAAQCVLAARGEQPVVDRDGAGEGGVGVGEIKTAEAVFGERAQAGKRAAEGGDVYAII